MGWDLTNNGKLPLTSLFMGWDRQWSVANDQSMGWDWTNNGKLPLTNLCANKR